MGLEETKKELEEQLEAALKAESQPVEESDEEENAADAEEEVTEAPKEEPKEDIKEDEPDAKGYARLRREAAAEKRAREALEQELAQLKSKPETEVTETAIPAEMQEMIHDHNLSKAEKELGSYEQQARLANPDYDAVAGAYATSVFQSLRVLNPDKSQFELMDMTKQEILKTAGRYLNAGHENPAEEMYQRAKEMGFKAPVKEEVKEQEELKKVDMAKLAANRAKSAGMAGSSGKSEGLMTPEHMASLSSAEYMKLPKAEKDRVLSVLKDRMAMGR